MKSFVSGETITAHPQAEGVSLPRSGSRSCLFIEHFVNNQGPPKWIEKIQNSCINKIANITTRRDVTGRGMSVICNVLLTKAVKLN